MAGAAGAGAGAVLGVGSTAATSNVEGAAVPVVLLARGAGAGPCALVAGGGSASGSGSSRMPTTVNPTARGGDDHGCRLREVVAPERATQTSEPLGQGSDQPDGDAAPPGRDGAGELGARRATQQVIGGTEPILAAPVAGRERDEHGTASLGRQVGASEREHELDPQHRSRACQPHGHRAAGGLRLGGERVDARALDLVAQQQRPLLGVDPLQRLRQRAGLLLLEAERLGSVQRGVVHETVGVTIVHRLAASVVDDQVACGHDGVRLLRVPAEPTVGGGHVHQRLLREVLDEVGITDARGNDAAHDDGQFGQVLQPPSRTPAARPHT
jgi:hypothetical protein